MATKKKNSKKVTTKKPTQEEKPSEVIVQATDKPATVDLAENKPSKKKNIFTLKLKRNHPRGQFRLGAHVITTIAKEYELNESELAELQTEGPKAWIATL